MDLRSPRGLEASSWEGLDEGSSGDGPDRQPYTPPGNARVPPPLAKKNAWHRGRRVAGNSLPKARASP